MEPAQPCGPLPVEEEEEAAGKPSEEKMEEKREEGTQGKEGAGKWASQWPIMLLC